MLFYEEETERNSSGNSEEASHHPFSSSFLPKCDEFNMRRGSTESCLELSSASFPSWLPSQTETLHGCALSHMGFYIYCPDLANGYLLVLCSAAPRVGQANEWTRQNSFDQNQKGVSAATSSEFRPSN